MNRITIVIITYNRYAYLKRLLKYYATYAPDVNILVLDSSNDVVPAEMAQALAKIQWRQYDTSTFIVNKIADGLKYVNTPLCVLCADDDFLVPRGLLQCANFLLKHPDYVSVHGRYISHQRIVVDEKSQMKWFPLYEEAVSIEDKEPVVRFNHFFPKKYSGYPFYAVYRTDDLRYIWEKTAQHVDGWGLSEIFPACAAILKGKMKILPVFYASKEANMGRWYSPQQHRDFYNAKRLLSAFNGWRQILEDTGNSISNTSTVLMPEETVEYFLQGIEKKPPRKEIIFRIKRKMIRGAHLWWWYASMGSNLLTLNKDLTLIAAYVCGHAVDQQLLERTRKSYLT